MTVSHLPRPIIVRTSPPTTATNTSRSPNRSRTRIRQRERELPPIPISHTSFDVPLSFQPHNTSSLHRTFHFYPQDQIRIVPVQTSAPALTPTPILVRVPSHHSYRRRSTSRRRSSSRRSFIRIVISPQQPSSPLLLPRPHSQSHSHSRSRSRSPTRYTSISRIQPGLEEQIPISPSLSSFRARALPHPPPPTPTPTPTPTPVPASSPSPIPVSALAPTPTPTPEPPPVPMSRYQEHFTPSQVSLASTQYRAREREKERLLRSPSGSTNQHGFGAPTSSTPASAGPTPAPTPGPGRQGPGLYGPSQVRRPPPRHPLRPRTVTVPAPLAPQGQQILPQAQVQPLQQGVTAFMMNGIPPGSSNTISLNTPPSSGQPAPGSQSPFNGEFTSGPFDQHQQQGELPPAILLTRDSHSNSPVVLRQAGFNWNGNGDGNGAPTPPPHPLLSQPAPAPAPSPKPQPQKRSRDQEERDREKERRDRARVLAGIGAFTRNRAFQSSPQNDNRDRDRDPSSRGLGFTSPPILPTSPTSAVSVSRSIIPPVLLPGGGIPTGGHITSKADRGRSICFFDYH